MVVPELWSCGAPGQSRKSLAPLARCMQSTVDLGSVFESSQTVRRLVMTTVGDVEDLKCRTSLMLTELTVKLICEREM